MFCDGSFIMDINLHISWKSYLFSCFLIVGNFRLSLSLMSKSMLHRLWVTTKIRWISKLGFDWNWFLKEYFIHEHTKNITLAFEALLCVASSSQGMILAITLFLIPVGGNEESKTRNGECTWFLVAEGQNVHLIHHIELLTHLYVLELLIHWQRIKKHASSELGRIQRKRRVLIGCFKNYKWFGKKEGSGFENIKCWLCYFFSQYSRST